jgi:hypothetical protein
MKIDFFIKSAYHKIKIFPLNLLRRKNELLNLILLLLLLVIIVMFKNKQNECILLKFIY